MAALLHSVSPITDPFLENTTKVCGFFPHISNLRTLSLNKGFPMVSASAQISSSSDSLFTLPKWRASKGDIKSKESINNAFRYLEYMVEKGHKPHKSQATQLLYEWCRLGKFQNGIRLMEMMVHSGVKPDPNTYTYLVNRLCKGGNVGYAMQLVEKMEEYGYPTNMVTYNSLVQGLCMWEFE